MRADTIAQWFLHKADVDDNSVSNLKLQKLVYLAESCYGSVHHGRLFEEPVQAWKNGPAIKPLYGIYKHNGNKAIEDPIPASEPGLDEDITEILETVWDYFGGYSPSALWRLSHNVGPYKDHFVEGARDVEIPADEIHDAWPKFLEQECSRRSPVTSNTRRAMRALIEHSRRQPVGPDERKMRADFDAFRVTA